MKLTISSHAQKQIKKLPKSIQVIVANKIRKLTSTDFNTLEKLSGFANFYKARIGTYRIVFIKYPKEIEIVLVAHRKEVYDLLTRL